MPLFKSQAISTRSPIVIVEYDARGKRQAKTFDNPYLARRFYLTKEKANKNPAVKKG